MQCAAFQFRFINKDNYDDDHDDDDDNLKCIQKLCRVEHFFQLSFVL